MISRGSARPEDLSGTHGEAALHCTTKIALASPDHETIFGGEVVEVFVTSKAVLIHGSSSLILVTIPYAAIILHAASSDPPALYLQIEDDELARDILGDSRLDSSMFELFMKPIDERQDSVNDLFSALSTCASMHPGLSKNDDSDDHDVAFTQMMGDPNHQWITAENAGQFDDARESSPAAANGCEAHEELDGPRKYRRTS